MPKCKRCGKRGLFLKLNDGYLCKECENALRIEANKRLQLEYSDSMFFKIVDIYSNLKKEHDYRRNSIDDSIKYIDSHIMMCSKLSDIIDSYILSDGFLDSIRKHETEGFSHFCKEIKGLNMTIFDHDTEYDIKNRIKEIPINLLSNFKKIKSRLLLDKNFIEKIDTINRHAIILNKKESCNLDVSNMDQIKYSNITSKTNYERLGNFISIDIETTGLSHINDDITEISAIKFEYWEPVNIFSTLVNPKKYIPDKITKLTGITNDMVKNSPYIDEIIDDLMEFIGCNNIVGHNLEFDLKFLYFHGLDILSHKRKYYDTLQIAKRTLKSFNNKYPERYYDVDDYKLTTLCEYYKIRCNLYAHRAESDCIATGYLLKNLACDKIS